MLSERFPPIIGLRAGIPFSHSSIVQEVPPIRRHLVMPYALLWQGRTPQQLWMALAHTVWPGVFAQARNPVIDEGCSCISQMPALSDRAVHRGRPGPSGRAETPDSLPIPFGAR